MADYHVYQGFWQNHYQSQWNQYVLTLEDNWAIIVTVVLGLLVSFVGNQGWVIVRHVTFSLWKRGSQTYGPATLELGRTSGGEPGAGAVDRLPDLVDLDVNLPEYYDPEDISQKDALLLCFGSRRKLQRHRRAIEYHSMSPEKRCLLGLVAGIWILCWLVAGPAIVYLLTNNGEETPLVQSGWTPCCGRLGNRSQLDGTTEAKEAERLFLTCMGGKSPNGMPCSTPWVGESAPQVLYWNTTCPFDNDTCLDTTPPVTLEHQITAESLGFNTPHKVTLDHRLTCAPLALDGFLLNRYSGPGQQKLYSFLNPKVALTDEWIEYASQYALILNSLNGPNRLSQNYSGWNARNISSFPVDPNLQTFPVAPPHNLTAAQEILDPRLRHPNGTTFIMVFFPGQTVLRGAGPLKDPFFRASRELDLGTQMILPPGSPPSDPENGIGYWLPDHEANAIVCLEQYQLCAQVDQCSGWRGSLEAEFNAGGPLIRPMEGLPRDQSLLFFNAFRFGSVFGYLGQNRHLLFATASQRANVLWWLAREGQWIQELWGLLDTAFLRARLTIVGSTLKRYDDSCGANFTNDYKQDPRFCSSILFPAEKYTNMSALSLLLVLFAGLAIMSSSFLIELRRRPAHVREHLVKVWRVCLDRGCRMGQATVLGIFAVPTVWTSLRTDGFRVPGPIFSAAPWEFVSSILTKAMGTGPTRGP
jgi:hypothetical protein